MEQTPVHDMHNPDLLKLIPQDAKRIVEVGCSSGALAREYKKNNPGCTFIGIEIDQEYSTLAKRFCDEVYVANIESIEDSIWDTLVGADCFVFGDTLEHLQDPWKVLRKIKTIIPPTGSIVCCVPNAQHWSLQVKLNIGDFRYVESGLLDKTHLRWFTRQTLIELFADTGFVVRDIQPRIFDEPQREDFIALLKRISKRAGVNPEEAGKDAAPFQYVLIATPKI